MKRWCIYIDIEGFGVLYEKEDHVLQSLGVLAEGILWIGQRCFPETPDRLFAHQTGDGFAIVSEFWEKTLERPLAIAVALMRHVAATGRFARAAISEGDFADISGCYPDSIRDAREENGRLRLGRGIMTLFPVIGTALIYAVRLIKNSPSGPLILVDFKNNERISRDFIVHEAGEPSILSIDWIHSICRSVDVIAQHANLIRPTIEQLEGLLKTYCRREESPPPSHWVDGVRDFLGVAL